MIEVTVKGRGGQGAKTFVEILAKAANYEGKFFLAYPEFGPERSGTPINAFFKLDERRIRSREPVRNPDIIVVLDSSLEKYDKELKKRGTLIINSPEEKHGSIDANTISKELSGRPNMVMLGAMIKITNLLKRVSVEKAIEDTFKGNIADINLRCFEEGYETA